MDEYHRLLDHVLRKGERKSDRTSVGTLSVFGCQSRYDLSSRFPLLTTKRLNFNAVVAELLWFISGSTTVHELVYADGSPCGIWDEWAAPDGELGPVYGKQWRSWAAPDGRSIDQIAQLVEGLKTNPDSRRHIVSAWNPADIDAMALPPCHCLFQFYVAGGRLSCQLYQRSADIFIGVPFNIASYSLLTLMLAQVVGLQPGEFIHTLGDAHLYANHLDQAREQLSRTPLPLPRVALNPAVRSIFDFSAADVTLLDYVAHPHIKAKIAV